MNSIDLKIKEPNYCCPEVSHKLDGLPKACLSNLVQELMLRTNHKISLE